MMIWMQSLEGGEFDLLNPTPEMISWHTASLVLGGIPRFNRHTLYGPYSVAQHCVEGARAVLRNTGNSEWAAAFLLHDVHEAYIGDIMTPVAKAIGALAVEDMGCDSAGILVNNAFKELKRRIDCAVYTKAEQPFYWLDSKAAAIVKEYDYRMAITERAARLAPHLMPWHSSIESQTLLEGCDLTPWNADLATALWRGVFDELLPGSLDVEIPAPSLECACGGCEPKVDNHQKW
jgi:uncharacterized protein